MEKKCYYKISEIDGDLEDYIVDSAGLAEYLETEANDVSEEDNKGRQFIISTIYLSQEECLNLAEYEF